MGGALGWQGHLTSREIPLPFDQIRFGTQVLTRPGPSVYLRVLKILILEAAISVTTDWQGVIVGLFTIFYTWRAMRLQPDPASGSCHLDEQLHWFSRGWLISRIAT
jgi:hypothetical protein